MRQMMKHLLGIGLVAFGTQAAWAYSLIGPPGFGDDSWQVPLIGFNPLTSPNNVPDIIDSLAIGPKNLGEAYRRNTPVIYYAADATFLDYFGSNGLAQVDLAYTMLNNSFSTNVDSFSPELTEFPLDSQGLNYTAQALGLYDLKSQALTLMAEQLGLADSIRYIWVLHNRLHVTPGPACPGNMEYTVVMRNYDISSTPLYYNPPDWGQYSPYVNGNLYTYKIIENCGAAGISPPDADAFEIPTDPLENTEPVASGNGEDALYIGEFYVGLTRDDMAGLRYLISTNNVNTESPAPGSQLLVTNLPSPQLITTLPLGPFILQSQTLPPTALQALYPGLIIVSTVTNYSFNVVPAGYSFTNQPGASGTVTNYSPPQELNPPPNQIPPPPGYTGWPGTMDFSYFTLQALTNTTGLTANPAQAITQLQALYPGLVIVSATPYFTNVTTTNYVTYLTNYPGSALGNPPVQVTVPSGTFTTFEARYTYVFGNLLLNSNGTFYPFVDYNTSRSLYGTNQTVTIQTISVTNAVGSPLGNPAVTNITTTVAHQYGITGDFFIEPTNWCGYTILTNYAPIKTILGSYTNAIVAAGTTNAAGGVAQFTENTIYTYTNWQFIIEPGVCEPGLYYLTNTTVSFVTNYDETFANIVTNSYFTNSLVTLVTTNIGPCPGGQAGELCTNIAMATFVTNTPSGDFWIEPPTWNCGYTILQVASTNSLTSSSTLYSAPIPPGVPNMGQQYSVTEIFYYTNYSLVIQPIICQTQPAVPRLYQGIGRMHFERADYDSLLSQFFQPITNVYSMVLVTNHQPVTQYFQRVVTSPDFLFTASDIISQSTAGITVQATKRGINFNESNVGAGLAGPGTIEPPTTFVFNKVGLVYYNEGPSYLNGPNDGLAGFVWGSYDSSTNAPVIYPTGASIQNLESQVLLRITSTPSTLPDATNGYPYSASFSATGGQAPYTWSLGSGTLLPQSLTLSTNGVVSGMVTNNVPGVYVFTIKLTDSANRVESVNYFITVH
jgi:Putative Ig domain